MLVGDGLELNPPHATFPGPRPVETIGRAWMFGILFMTVGIIFVTVFVVALVIPPAHQPATFDDYVFPLIIGPLIGFGSLYRGFRGLQLKRLVGDSFGIRYYVGEKLEWDLPWSTLAVVRTENVATMRGSTPALVFAIAGAELRLLPFVSMSKTSVRDGLVSLLPLLRAHMIPVHDGLGWLRDVSAPPIPPLPGPGDPAWQTPPPPAELPPDTILLDVDAPVVFTRQTAPGPVRYEFVVHGRGDGADPLSVVRYPALFNRATLTQATRFATGVPPTALHPEGYEAQEALREAVMAIRSAPLPRPAPVVSFDSGLAGAPSIRPAPTDIGPTMPGIAPVDESHSARPSPAAHLREEIVR